MCSLRRRHTVRSGDKEPVLGFYINVSELSWSEVGRWFSDLVMRPDMSYTTAEDLAIGMRWAFFGLLALAG